MLETFNKIKKYNIWDGKELNTGFERSEYLNKISDYIENKIIKVLVGQRRSGKSYLMRQIIHFLRTEKRVNPGNIFYLNKEFTAFNEIISASDLEDLFEVYKKQIHPTGKVYVFLDEVQNIDRWETFVNSYSQDFVNEYELFITGSNSNLLSGELASLLSGRYVEFEIMPFSFSEITGFRNREPNKENFVNYLKTGGLPELLHIEKEEMQRHYVDSLKNTIILRDIVERYNIKDVSLLEDIFKFLMVNIGNLSSVSKIISYFKSKQRKTNYETLSAYIDYLTGTFILQRAERFNLRGKQVLGGECKYYLNDLAFKNYLLGFSPFDIGYNLENYVFLNLKRAGYDVRVGVLNNLEVDFVAQKSDKTLYVQVCYLLNSQKVIEREFGNLLLIKDNHEKIVISMDDMKFSEYEGVKHARPWDLVI
jgi:uncharacterized protein